MCIFDAEAFHFLPSLELFFFGGLPTACPLPAKNDDRQGTGEQCLPRFNPMFMFMFQPNE